MQPIFFIVAIMGCGDGSTGCQDARIVEAHYQNIQQCRAALPEQIAANTDVPFPVIGAECRRASDVYAGGKSSSTRG